MKIWITVNFTMEDYLFPSRCVLFPDVEMGRMKKHSIFCSITSCDSDGKLMIHALDAEGVVWWYSEGDNMWYPLGDKRYEE